MGYYVNKNQFMDQDFLKTLEYLKSTGVKVSPEISTIYTINAEVASGNYTNLREIERQLDASSDQVQSYKEKISEAKANKADALKQYREAKRNHYESNIFSREAKQAKQQKRQAKKGLDRAKQHLQETRKAYETFLARLTDTQGRKKEIDEVLQSCKDNNEALKAEIQGQIDLITDYRARVRKLGADSSDLNRTVTFNGETKPLGLHVKDMKQKLNGYLQDGSFTISTMQPISMDSQPFQELEQVESIVYRNEQELTEHQQKGVAKGKEELEAERQEYISRTVKFLNKQSRGDTNRDDDDDGR